MFDKDFIDGFGKRKYLWDVAATVQHELTPQVSLTVGYFRNWQGNFPLVDNVLVGPEDFDTFCYTAPRHPDLPGGGAYGFCNLADLNPASFRFENVIKRAQEFGDHTLISDFVNLEIDTRFASGIVFGGGVDFGRTVEGDCFIVDSPQDLLHCRVVTPWSAQTQVKFHGSVPLPYDVAVSGVFQSTAGNDIEAIESVSSAVLEPALGRRLAFAARKAIPLVATQTLFLPRRNQLDLRVAKRMPLGDRLRLEGALDVYNVFNASDVNLVVSTFGPAWLRPIRDAYAGGAILTGRLLQLSGRLTF